MSVAEYERLANESIANAQKMRGVPEAASHTLVAGLIYSNLAVASALGDIFDLLNNSGALA